MKKENIPYKKKAVFVVLALLFVFFALLTMSVSVYVILGFAEWYLGRSLLLSTYRHDIYGEDGRFFVVLKRHGEAR